MYSSMTGDDPGATGSGSVVLRLSGSNRRDVVSALRRTLEPHANATRPLSQSFMATAANNGLGAVLLQQDRYAGADTAAQQPNDAPPLGTWMGVFVPCTCTIFGDVVFLRLGFVVGQAGIWCTLVIVFSAFALCFLTTLSLCMLIGEGGDEQAADLGNRHRALDPGVYAALRKAVGPELGAVIGLTLYLAFSVNVAFYVTGFAAMLSDSLPQLRSTLNVFPWNPAGKWVDVVVASIALLVLTAICSRGVVFSARASLATLIGILFCIVASILCVLVPTGAPTFTGFNLSTWQSNTGPELSAFAGSTQEGGQSMMLMFVLVFPGTTRAAMGVHLS